MSETTVPMESSLTEKDPKKRISRRADLIRAGIEEINRYGIADFSVRRVAEVCGVSCGAPYKHFGNRNGFIAAIVQYINKQWYDIQDGIMAAYPGDSRAQLIESCVRYVQFLMENPHFRSIILMKDEQSDGNYRKARAKLSMETQKMIIRYCHSAGMDVPTLQRKRFILRNLVYGAIFTFDSGKVPYNEENLRIVRDSIEREFSLP